MGSIEAFLTIERSHDLVYGHGQAEGYGFSNGEGDGYIPGAGEGCVYYSSGCEDGRGKGSGTSAGGGTSRGCGYGCLNYCWGIISFNGRTVYMIDRIPTIITNAKRNLAKGFILRDNLTTTPCYIAKCGNLFAHCETLEEAREALQDKLFSDMPEEEHINMFLTEFNTTDKYPAKLFYDWHHRLTRSCKAGRQTFIKNHDIDLENDSFTVREFCELCKNDYGGNIIEKILNKI